MMMLVIAVLLYYNIGTSYHCIHEFCIPYVPASAGRALSTHFYWHQDLSPGRDSNWPSPAWDKCVYRYTIGRCKSTDTRRCCLSVPHPVPIADIHTNWHSSSHFHLAQCAIYILRSSHRDDDFGHCSVVILQLRDILSLHIRILYLLCAS